MRWPSLGSALVLAGVLACGGRASSPRAAPEGSVRARDEVLPPVTARDDMPAAEVMPEELPEPGLLDPEPPEPEPPSELEQVAFGILDQRCGACHSHGADAGGIGDILDLDNLLARFSVWRIPAETTRLILILRYGDDIAAHTPPLVSTGELDTLVRFFDSLDDGVRAGCGRDQYSPDGFQRALLDDISRYAMGDREFIRYLALPDSDACGIEGLQRQVFDVMNGTSTADVAVLPRCEPWARIYCAIDLRDYGWNRPVDWDGDGQPDFEDGWEAALAAAGPYAVQLTGTEAVEVASQTQTLVPVLPIGAFVHAVIDGPLYYALTDARRVVQGLLTTREVRADDPAPAVVRAGRFGVPPRSDRAVTRYAPNGNEAGPIWTLEELENGFLQRAPVFRSFLGGELIFGLPNGMRAFAIAGADGTTLADLPGCLDGLACPLRARSPATCLACHQSGLLEVSDQVGPAAPSLLPTYGTETISAFTAQYVSAETLAALIAEDNQREASVRESASADLARGGNRIPHAFFNFEKALSLLDAAEELGTDFVSLGEVLRALSTDRRIAPLQPLLVDGGRVDRAAFSAAYELLLCADLEAQNRPVNCPVR